MYKNQLQELAQRSCFNLPSYSCTREGPDHAPRFKATVNFNGEKFESPTFCSTLRQAEHAAAEVALGVLSQKGPSKALAARDETGVYKNLLQETAHRAGLKLPVYTTIRSGPGHVPVFSCTVELAGMSFTGELAKTKKQAQKNAALSAWSALKKLSKSASSPSSSSSSLSESSTNDEQEQVIIARYLATLRPREMKNSQQRELRLGRGYAPVQTDVIPYGNTRSFSLQQQNWQCSQISPELSLYQTCTKQIASQQQDRLLALSSLPLSCARPQFFPIIRSILQPDQGHYSLSQSQELNAVVPEIGPFLYLSNDVMPLPAWSVSQLTIQEVEENPQMEEEWLKGSNVPRLSPTEIPNPLVSLKGQSEDRVLDVLQERNEKKRGSSASNTGNSIHPLQHNQTEQCNFISAGFMDARFRPRAMSTDASKFHSQNQEGLDFSSSNIRPSNPSMVSSSGTVTSFVPASFAAPVTIRTSGVVSTGSSIRPQSSNPLVRTPSPTRISTSAYSSRPWPEGKTNLGFGPPVNCMAPAVHIRSVVPVCSAPPPKKFPGPSREGSFSGVEKKICEEQRGEISDASSNFSKLDLCSS